METVERPCAKKKTVRTVRTLWDPCAPVRACAPLCAPVRPCVDPWGPVRPVFPTVFARTITRFRSRANVGPVWGEGLLNPSPTANPSQPGCNQARSNPTYSKGLVVGFY